VIAGTVKIGEEKNIVNRPIYDGGSDAPMSKELVDSTQNGVSIKAPTLSKIKTNTLLIFRTLLSSTRGCYLLRSYQIPCYHCRAVRYIFGCQVYMAGNSKLSKVAIEPTGAV
jgi:hypothetical protein